MKNASSDGVKAYGEMLIKQHTANDNTLKGFVKQTHQIIHREAGERCREAGQGRGEGHYREAQDDDGRGLRDASTCG